MKLLKNFGVRLGRLTGSIRRYPFTVAFLVAAATMIAVEISTDRDLLKLILTCAVGAVSCAAGQAAFERFFHRLSARLSLMAAGCILAAVHYMLILQVTEYSPEMRIRTAVTIFALFVAFIWITVIRSRVSFNESFMAAFKSFFQSVFYSAVIMGGCSAIIAAIDRLIIPVDSDVYSYTANIVFVLFAPVFFLSLIPVYPGRKDKASDPEIAAAQDELITKRAYCPKFLEVLLSYIIIPLASVFTVILLLYIVFNIRGEFWTDNLLEPMLISYSITIILVTILVSRLENKFAVLFRRIFPKVLIPIVLFQIASSLLILRDTGVTYSRYYVILYGIFAVCSGAVLSMVPARKNGIIAVLLIVFSAISIIPPADAFTVSRISQINTMESVLARNGMLSGNVLTPNGSISNEDKSKITSSIQYLRMTEDLDKVSWLPADFNADEGFYNTFGFREYEVQNPINRYVNVYFDTTVPIPIDGYDYFTQAYIMSPESYAGLNICKIERDNKTFSLTFEEDGDHYDIVLTDESGQDIVRFDADEILSRYQSYYPEKSAISIEEATFSAESELAELTVIVQNAGIGFSSDQMNFNAQLFIFVRFK